MIATTNPYSINTTPSEAWRQTVSNGTTTSQDFQAILNATTGQQEKDSATDTDKEAVANPSANLESILRELLGGSDTGTVNEEQLFASIIHDRIASSKGEAAAGEYDALLDTKLTEHTRADGFVYVEEAARAALQEMQTSGKLTTAEAETIHAQAFQAAQLDETTSALYDSRGDTMSVAPTASAMEKALAMLLKFDNGEVASGRMPLSYRQGQAVESTATGTATSTGTATGTSSTDTASGYTHSAEYVSYGVRNGGRQAWRIPDSGPEFGSKLKVVFEDGHTVYVNDTSHNYRESDGFVFKPGIGENGEGSANTGTAHGGVYLHAPYGNDSQTVKFYWS